METARKCEWPAGCIYVFGRTRLFSGYPIAFEGYWYACTIDGDNRANKLNVDDVAFLTTLVDKLRQETVSSASRVSRPAFSVLRELANRLALEAPSRYRVVAAVGANVPTPENFRMQLVGRRSVRIL